jgi:hypothetical protein
MPNQQVAQVFMLHAPRSWRVMSVPPHHHTPSIDEPVRQQQPRPEIRTDASSRRHEVAPARDARSSPRATTQNRFPIKSL